MSLSDCLSSYRAGVTKINDFISIAYEVDAAGDYLFDSEKQEFIITSAFLRMFIFWEDFIESSFSSYLTGCVSTDGTVVHAHVTPVDKEHSLKILVGTQRYVDWANHDIVRRLSTIYLEDNNTFTSNIAAASSTLSDLRTIRNSAAHVSTSTQPQIDALATRVLQTSSVNISVADLIMSIHPEDSTKTLLLYYQDILDIVAENIAANRA